MSVFDANSIKRASKFMSLVLRHQPEQIGLHLDAQGWANIDELLQKLARHGLVMDRQSLNLVVETNDKKRFALSEDGQRIRASQGHSVNIDLGLKAVEPPAWLYHGTVPRFVSSIYKQGLLPGERQHVHLSLNRQTAQDVGSRRGSAVILAINAGKMHADGHEFYCSENGVWLTKHVPTQYISGGVRR